MKHALTYCELTHVKEDVAGHLIDQNVSEQQPEVKLPFRVAGSRELLLQQARQLPPVGDMLRTGELHNVSTGQWLCNRSLACTARE